jgi:hypothetical protein
MVIWFYLLLTNLKYKYKYKPATQGTSGKHMKFMPTMRTKIADTHNCLCPPHACQAIGQALNSHIKSQYDRIPSEGTERLKEVLQF